MGCFLSKTSTDARDDRSNLPAPLPHQSIDPIESSSSSDKKNRSHAPAHLSHHSPFLDPIESSLSSDEENQIHAPAQSLIIDPIESSSSSDEEENQSHAPASENAEIHKMKEYGFKELAEATDYFSNNCLLGEGGFGQVFKATLDGEDVAIKKLKKIKLEDKLEEGEYLSCVNHPNIVKMIGHCTQGADRLLVLEFVPNNTLTYHLHELITGRKPLDKQSDTIINWAKDRIGQALDNEYENLVDSRLQEYDKEEMIRMICCAAASVYKPSHFRPIMKQRLSDKTDVYSFGVVLLELITGKTPILREGNVASAALTSWVRAQLKEVLDTDNYNNIVDVKLKNNYKKIEMIRMIHCAAACVYKPVKYRPKMSQCGLAVVLDCLAVELACFG
ncbi:hypothetical protein GH714_021340 [Hevea brasiliensis]|uniref:non-specific serine/threonine protein kinase n=1 Tax=Hevea brasiliensis TaxID=3981 RepID=A0A6A6LME2_HEVBR|nr:hypothetical protein GH714_021340 [Hevea brasiliensis]